MNKEVMEWALENGFSVDNLDETWIDMIEGWYEYFTGKVPNLVTPVIIN